MRRQKIASSARADGDFSGKLPKTIRCLPDGHLCLEGVAASLASSNRTIGELMRFADANPDSLRRQRAFSELHRVLDLLVDTLKNDSRNWDEFRKLRPAFRQGWIYFYSPKLKQLGQDSARLP